MQAQISIRRLVAVSAMAAIVAGCAAPRQAVGPTGDAQVGQMVDQGLQQVQRTQRAAPAAAAAAPTSALSGQVVTDRRTNVSFQVVGYNQINGWSRDDHAAALRSFNLSCQRINGLRDTSVIGGVSTTIADWRGVCAAASQTSPAAARAFFEQNFTPVRIAPGETALLTGYYEPELLASRSPTGAFQFPIYRKPPELVSRSGRWGRDAGGGALQPYFTRRQIYDGALNGRGLEIAYLNDAVDLFFLQIQGSGRLRFQDGTVLRVGYAGKNGYDFRSAGREMMRRGLSRSGSKADLQAYTRQNLAAGLDLLSFNQSYVFFREMTTLDPNGGPEGALSVQLSDLRSIAVDRRFQPLGAPVWVEGGSGAGPIAQLMVAQDTGSAIRGPQRADIFFGSGAAAGQVAGRTRARGLLTTLLPNVSVARLVGAGS